VRVRSLQVHDSERQEAFAGERVAVNVAGVAKEKISRGDILADPGWLRPTYMVDARVRILRDWTRPVKRGSRVRFHHGTREVLGRIYPLEVQQIGPGESVAAQIRLEEMVVVAPSDRFVVRSYSPVTTIGGGTVVDSHPSKHRVHDPEAVRQFAELESPDDPRTVAIYLDRAGVPATAGSLVLASGLPPAAVDAGLNELSKGGGAVSFGDKAAPLFMSAGKYEDFKSRTLSELEAFHAAKPLAEGMARETLKKRALAAWDARSADIFMDALDREGAIESEGKVVRLPGKTSAVTSEQEQTLDSIVQRVAASPVAPPTVSELAAELGQTRQSVAELLAIAEKDKRLVRVSPELYFSPEAIADIEAGLRQTVGPDGISVSDFKNVVGTSRKFALPLLEYFDRMRVTARVGDVRKLR
jgi:selenocysteine-specific elongation factor